MTETCSSCHRDYQGVDARFCPLCGAPVDSAKTLLFGADPFKQAGIPPEEVARYQAAVATTIPRQSAETVGEVEIEARPASSEPAIEPAESASNLEEPNPADEDDERKEPEDSLFADDSLLIVPKRSYRGLWLAAGAVALVIGTWTVASATSSHGSEAVAEATTEAEVEEPDTASVTPEPAEVAALPTTPEVAPTPAEPVVTKDRSRKARKRAKRSRRKSRSAAPRSRSVDTSTLSLEERARAAASSLLDSPAAAQPAAPAPSTSPAPLPAAPPAAAPPTSAPSPAPVAKQPTKPSADQPLDPFSPDKPASQAPAKPAKEPSEQPVDPFGPEAPPTQKEPPAKDQPIDPFPGDKPAKEQPIDPFA